MLPSVLSSRLRGTTKHYRLCLAMLLPYVREMASAGLIPGVKKASW